MEQNDEMMRITLIGEDNSTVEFEHVLTFMYENERYMALTPADVDDEEAEIVFIDRC